MGWWEHFGFAPYGKFWRKSRRMFHQEFRHDAVKNLHPEQLKARDELLRRLLDTPERWMEHLRQCVPRFLPVFCILLTVTLT